MALSHSAMRDDDVNKFTNNYIMYLKGSTVVGKQAEVQIATLQGLEMLTCNGPPVTSFRGCCKLSFTYKEWDSLYKPARGRAMYMISTIQQADSLYDVFYHMTKKTRSNLCTWVHSQIFVPYISTFVSVLVLQIHLKKWRTNILTCVTIISNNCTLIGYIIIYETKCS